MFMQNFKLVVSSSDWPSSSDDEDLVDTAGSKPSKSKARSRLTRRESLRETMAVDVPKEMTDVGKYSYAAMCGVNLHNMFGDSNYNK